MAKSKKDQLDELLAQRQEQLQNERLKRANRYKKQRQFNVVVSIEAKQRILDWCDTNGVTHTAYLALAHKALTGEDLHPYGEPDD